MTKTLYITNGPYAGQYLTLDAPHEEAAIADEWAVDTSDPEFDRYSFPAAINEHPYPHSLDSFLAEVNNEEVPETSPTVDKTAVVERRKTAREDQRKQREQQQEKQAKREQREQVREQREQREQRESVQEEQTSGAASRRRSE